MSRGAGVFAVCHDDSGAAERPPEGALALTRGNESRDQKRRPRDVGVHRDALRRRDDLAERGVWHRVDRSLKAGVDLHVAHTFASERERPTQGGGHSALSDVGVGAPCDQNVLRSLHFLSGLPYP